MAIFRILGFDKSGSHVGLAKCFSLLIFDQDVILLLGCQVQTDFYNRFIIRIPGF